MILNDYFTESFLLNTTGTDPFQRRMLVGMLLEDGMSKLSARRVDTLKEPGFYGDSDGLYLSVKPSGSKSWMLRTVVHGKRRDLGIGSADLMSLAEARDKAREWRKIARDGGDPDASRNTGPITFEEADVEYHRPVAQSFRRKKHAAQWLAGLKKHVFLSPLEVKA